MTNLEILKAVRELLATPDKWIKYELAVNGLNCPLVSANDPKACKWCLEGAIRKVIGVDGDGWDNPTFMDVQTIIENANKFAFADNSLWQANDEDKTTHADVLQWLDNAIMAEERWEQQAQPESDH